MWKYCFNHGLQRRKYKRTKVIPGSSRFRTCYSSQNDDAVFPLRPSPILLTHFSALFLPQLSCITPYNILFIKHFAAEMLPLAFFFLILNYLNLLFVMVSIAMFFYQFSPPSLPHLGLIWEDLRNVLIFILLHVAYAYLLVWGKQDVFPFLKKPIDRTDYTEILLLYHSAFCFSLVSFKKFQQQSCYSVGMMDCKCLELCILVPAVNFIVLCWMIF